MIKKLQETLQILPALLLSPDNWSSLIVNRRKPFTYRVFRQLGDMRVCLHKFDTCDEHESFPHPHPWPGAFVILSGGYKMWVGSSETREGQAKDVASFILMDGSMYEITSPLTWHSVTPLTTTYTVMINQEPWAADVAHKDVKTTKGKDLDSLRPDELEQHLATFRKLVEDYNRASV